MRVVCNSIDEFLLDLETHNNGCLHQNAIRCSVSKNPVDGNKRDAVRFAVNIQFSAIIMNGPEDQYLLEAGEDCGFDYKDTTQEYIGTEEADRLKSKLESVCKRRGWVIRPGIIEL